MGVIQFLERSGGQAKWSAQYPLEVGYTGSWVLDKTTDSGTLYRIRVIGEADKPPMWSNMDWCRVFHGDGAAIPQYNNEGLPINHEQWLVMSPEKIYNPITEKWVVSFSLAEPIERARFINCETLTFTNQTLKTVIDNGVTKRYVKDAYNHATALERVLKVTPANCDSYATGYNKAKNVSWFNRIKILDRTFLAGLPFADSTFDELTLYNILLDNYDSSTGRTPAFFFDINPAWDLPYNSARDEYVLKFLRQDGFDKPVIEYADLTHRAAQIVESEDIANFATGLVANVQNLSAGAEVHYPSKSRFIAPELDTDERNTLNSPKNVSGSDNWILRLPEAIKRVTKLVEYEMEGGIDSAGGQTAWSLKSAYKDITADVYEKKQYLAAETDPPPVENSRLVWYEEGKNEVHIKRYYSNTDRKTSIYNVTYEPLIDCKLIVGDEDYTQQINQTSSQIDSTKFAGFLEQYQKGMNKADILIIKTYYDFNEFKDNLGCRVKRGNREYLITALSYKNRNRQYDVVYQLNENHFRKSNSYQAPQDVRINLNIGIDNVKKRMTAMKQKFKINAFSYEHTESDFLNDESRVAAVSALILGGTSVNFAPQIAGIRIKSTLNKQGGGTEQFTKFFALPITKFRFGKQINLNVRFYDNALAGKQRSIPENSMGVTFPTEPFHDITQQKPVLYTDYFGETNTFDLYLSNIREKTGGEWNYKGEEDSFYRIILTETATFFHNTLVSPVPTDGQTTAIIDNSILTILDHVDSKDMLEDWNKNIIIEYESDDFIICAGLLELSRLLNDDFNSTEMRIELYRQNIAEHDNVAPAKVILVNSTLSFPVAFNLRCMFEPITDLNFSSFAISTLHNGEYKKLLIMNDVNDTIKNNMTYGTLFFNY